MDCQPDFWVDIQASTAGRSQGLFRGFFCRDRAKNTSGKSLSGAKPAEFFGLKRNRVWHGNCNRTAIGLYRCSLPASCKAASLFQFRSAYQTPDRGFLFPQGYHRRELRRRNGVGRPAGIQRLRNVLDVNPPRRLCPSRTSPRWVNLRLSRSGDRNLPRAVPQIFPESSRAEWPAYTRI